MSVPERILVVGASLAGLRAAEALRAEGHEGALVVLGEEYQRPYDRPPLSKELLAGDAEAADVALPGGDALDATWILGDPAVALDLHERVVTTEAGRRLAFDRLLIATGSRARVLPAVDLRRPGVHVLRSLDDALALRAELATARRLVVIGSGFIGVEVASTARRLGLEVELVSLDPPLAVAGSLVSATATRLLLDHEVGLHVGGTIAGIAGSGRAEGVLLQDGGVVAGDVVLCAVGAVPATDWLAGSGLDLDNGVVCDAWGAAVGADGVVAAAGDVAAWPNARFGSDPLRVEHWTNASEQGRAAARTLLHGPGHGPPHAEIPTFWSDHFGVRLQSVGLPGRADRFEVVDGDVAEGRFAAAAYAGEALVGAVAYGRPKALMALRRQLADPQHAPVLDRSPT